jgi:CBS domain-containing protein
MQRELEEQVKAVVDEEHDGPGQRLGPPRRGTSQAMTRLVRDVMAAELKVATEDMTAVEGARLMASYDFGMVPVVGTDKRLVGVVTDRDLVVRVLAKGIDPNDIDLMSVATTKNIATIGPDETLREAEDLMAEHRVKRLPVVEGDELVGVVALGDVAVTAGSPENVGETVAEISRSPATEEVRGAREPATGTPAQVARDVQADE